MVAMLVAAGAVAGVISATATAAACVASPTEDVYNTGGGDWSVAGNWSLQAVPGPGVVACWNAGDTVTVTDAESADSIQAGGTLAIASGGTLTLTSSSNPYSVGALSIDGGGELDGSGASTPAFTSTGAFTWGATSSGAADLNMVSLGAGSVAIDGTTSTPTIAGGSVTAGSITFNTASGVSGSGAAFSAGSVVPAAGGASGFGTNSLTLTGGTTTVTSGETLGSGGLAVTSASTLTDDGTVSSSVTLTGGSTLAGTGSVSGIVNTSGTVSPGDPAPGVLSDTGSFSQGAGGTLAVVIQGTGSTQYSQLAVTGSATLGGHLSVTDSGFSPANGDTFTPVTYGSLNSGLFTLNGPNASIYGQSTSSTAVTLTANTAPPNCPSGSDVFTPTSGSSGDWLSGGTWSPATPGAGSIACWATSTTVSVGSGDTVSAAEVQGGTLNVSGGTLTLTSASDVSDLSALSVTSSGVLLVEGTVNASPTSVSGSGTLTDDGTVSSSVTLTTGGTLAGTGSVGGIVNTSGTVSPGAPAPGVLSDTGNFSQGAGGTLAVVIQGTAGTQYSQLHVTGSATLGGNLSVTDSGGFSPANGETFTPMSYGSLSSGSFALTGPDAGSYLQSAGASGVTLTAFIAPPNCPSGSNVDVFTPTTGNSGDWVGGGTWVPATPTASSIACWATSTTVDVGPGDNVTALEIAGGALNISGGTLALAGGGSAGSTLAAATTAPPGPYALQIAAGGALGGAGQTLTVAGNFNWGDTGASATDLNHSSPNNALNINQTSGSLTIGGAGGGSEDWGGGSISTSGPVSISNTVTHAGAPTLTTTAGLTLGGATMASSGTAGTLTAAGVTNTGTTAAPGFNLHLTAGSNSLTGALTVDALTTDPGTTLGVPTSAALSVNSGTISGTVNGAGTFTAGAGTTTVAGALSTNTVAVAGTLTVNSGATYAAGSATNISSGTLTLLNSTNSTGSVTLTGGGLRGGSSDSLAVSGPFVWGGSSTINGAGGALAIDQTASSATTLTVSGTPAFDGGSISTNSPVSVTSATFATTGAPSLTTSSTLTLAPSTVVSGSGSSFTAAGLGSGAISTAYDFGPAALTLTGGTTTLAGTGSLHTGQLAIIGGTLQDDGMIVPSATSVAVGTLDGTGTVSGPVTNSSGFVSPGDGLTPGVLTFTGSYSQGAGATLAIELNGTTAGSGFSELVVGGTAALNGNLSLADGGGFAPSPPQTFKILSSSGARTGIFGPLVGPGHAAYVAQYNPNDVTLTVNPAPGNVAAPAITGTPAVGQTLSCSQGTWSAHPTSFTYQWSRDGSPIAGAAGSTYVVATADQGHSLTCTVTASNTFGPGQPATSAGVSVPPAPVAPSNTVAPAITGKPAPGNKLSCSPGTWSNSPTAFAYKWDRNGSPIAGATGSSYTVQIGDEAGSLSCIVTASNAVGPGTPHASAVVIVALPGTLSCKQPSGKLTATALGPFALGATRAHAHRTIARYTAVAKFVDSFCLYGGWGIRVGYPTGRMIGKFPHRVRRKLKGTIVLALTVNPYYSLQGARPGTALSAVAKRLKVGRGLHVGVSYWYFVPGKSSDGVLRVQGGIIQEVGIANRALTKTSADQKRFVNPFSAA